MILLQRLRRYTFDPDLKSVFQRLQEYLRMADIL